MLDIQQLLRITILVVLLVGHSNNIDYQIFLLHFAKAQSSIEKNRNHLIFFLLCLQERKSFHKRKALIPVL